MKFLKRSYFPITLILSLFLCSFLQRGIGAKEHYVLMITISSILGIICISLSGIGLYFDFINNEKNRYVRLIKIFKWALFVLISFMFVVSIIFDFLDIGTYRRSLIIEIEKQEIDESYVKLIKGSISFCIFHSVSFILAFLCYILINILPYFELKRTKEIDYRKIYEVKKLKLLYKKHLIDAKKYKTEKSKILNEE